MNIRKISPSISSILIIILLLQLFFCFDSKENISYLQFLKFEVIIFYIIIVILSKKLYRKWEHPFVVILGTFFLFCLSRVVLDILGFWDLSISDKFRYYQFTSKVLIETLECLLLFLVFYFWGGNVYLIFNLKKFNTSMHISENLINKKIGKIFFILGILGSLSSKLKEFRFIRNYGYLSIYTGEILKIEKNFLEKTGITFLIFGYLLILLGKISRKKFLIYSNLLLVVYFIDSLKGGRGNFISMILVVIILDSYIYNKKIEFKKIILLIIGIIIFGSWINMYRAGNSDYFFKSFNSLKNFFKDQGVSLLVLSHIIDFKKEFHNNGVPFILAPFFDTIQSILYRNIYNQGQTEEYINLCKGLGSQLSYFLNKNLYLNGNGVGGNFLAEYYEFLNLKFIGVTIWSFFSGFFVPKLFDIFKTKKIGIIFLVLNLGYIIYIPRSSLFRFDYLFTIRICTMYIFYKIFIKILLLRRYKK